MSGSVPKIEKLLKEAEGDIEAIKDGLVDLKEYLLAWGAQDEKVIEEWAPSR